MKNSNSPLEIVTVLEKRAWTLVLYLTPINTQYTISSMF